MFLLCQLQEFSLEHSLVSSLDFATVRLALARMNARRVATESPPRGKLLAALLTDELLIPVLGLIMRNVYILLGSQISFRFNSRSASLLDSLGGC